MIRRACGVDVHRDNFVATILTGGGCETRGFEKRLEDMEVFKAWLRAMRCRRVVMESTGVYWIPLYAALEDEFEVKLAIAAIIAGIVFIFLMSSGKLIRREKFLP
jgi:transposase